MICHPTPKINIGLNVLRKREDGFHDIETLFYPVDAFHDELSIVRSKTFSINIEGAYWNPMGDITAKAWRLMADEYGIGPVAIRMIKHIPVGAGLGGGSADGACALGMLNELFELNLPTQRLEQLAGRLGADCAFFIKGVPQWGSGIGDILEPADIDLSDYEIRIAIPSGVHVNTAEAYKGLTPHETSEPLRDVVSLPVEQWRGRVVNDFEATVFAAHPEIAALKEQMYRDGAVYASMSGSGAAVYGIFSTTPRNLGGRSPKMSIFGL